MNPPRPHLLGGFRLTNGQGRVIEITAKKNRALIGILALAPHCEVTRDRQSQKATKKRAPSAVSQNRKSAANFGASA